MLLLVQSVFNEALRLGHFAASGGLPHLAPDAASPPSGWKFIIQSGLRRNGTSPEAPEGGSEGGSSKESKYWTRAGLQAEVGLAEDFVFQKLFALSVRYDLS
jgi:hypothetical protein